MPPTSDNAKRAVPWLLGAALAFALFRALWTALVAGDGAGSSVPQAPPFALFALAFSVLGTIALLSAAVGFVRAAQRQGAASAFAARWLAPSSRTFLWVTGSCAGLLALACHVLVLDGARLSDGEPASTMTVLGGPLLLAPGAALDRPQLMNPLYHGLTVPAVYMILREEVGAAWARAGTVLFASAPMLLIGAATLMPHTSSLFVLAWTWWLMMRASHEDARASHHVAFAAMLALAGSIRPTAALGIGAPLAVALLYRMRAGPRRRPFRLALAALASLGALALALVLTLSSGHPYADFGDPARMLAAAASGFVRLHFDLLGWPIGLLAATLALGDRRARLSWWAAAGFAVVHLPVTEIGIDAFGPVHWHEIALPVLVLCTIGLARAHRVITARGGAGALPLVPCLIAAAILCAWLGYVPVRATALRGLAGVAAASAAR